MTKISFKRLKGSQSLRLRLVLSTLSSVPIHIEDIHAEGTLLGLRPHEISLLRLLELVSDGCVVEINETGTKLKYRPGIVIGGRNLVHDCGTSRSIGYFLEPLIVLGLFGKRPLNIRLKGITNDAKDPSVDTFLNTTLPMLKQFGVSSEGLGMKIESRGLPPHGGGEVILSVPIVENSLKAVNWTDEGMVKRIRGIAFSSRVSVEFARSVINSARGVFNQLLPDVYIVRGSAKGPKAGNSPGYAISLHAETTSGCVMSADTAVFQAQNDDDVDEEKDLSSPEDIGKQVALAVLSEIQQGGVVDSTHQGLLFLLCAMCPPDVSKVRVGKLSPYGIEVLRHIKDFLRVEFVIKPEPSTETVILKCVGCGLKNLSRKVS